MELVILTERYINNLNVTPQFLVPVQHRSPSFSPSDKCREDVISCEIGEGFHM